MTIENIAEIVHEIQVAFCGGIGEHLPAWKEAPDHMKKSTIQGVQFHLDNPSAGQGASHVNWMEEKMRQGWVYGPVRDAEKKEHPSLLPFEELSKNEQMKDILFVTTVHNLSKHI